MTVRISKEEEYQAARGLTQVELMKRFINKNHKATEGIVAAYTRDPKDVILTATSVEARENLEALAYWAADAYPSAKVLKQTFRVAVQGASLSLLNEDEQELGLKKIAEDNAKRNLGVKILSFAWPKHAWKEKRAGGKKEASTLLVDVTTPEEVNKLVEEGLVLGANHLLCRRWDRAAEIRMCFRCQGYGHAAPTCKGKLACGHCGGEHDTRQHDMSRAYRKKCASCEGSHGAWDKACTVRVAEQKKVDQKRNNQPRLYETKGLRKATGMASVAGAEEFTIVQPKNAKKRKSRVIEGNEAQATQVAPTPVPLLQFVSPQVPPVAIPATLSSIPERIASSEALGLSQEPLPLSLQKRLPGRPPKLATPERGQQKLASSFARQSTPAAQEKDVVASQEELNNTDMTMDSPRQQEHIDW